MDHRVQFDFEVEFTNGGGIQGQEFRLDIAGEDIADEVLAEYIVQDMRLLMVGKVTILNKTIIQEPHKRKPIDGDVLSERTYIDLSHTIHNGMITHKGLPALLICDYLSREESKKNYVEGTTFQIGKIEMVTNTGTYLDCPFHRYEEGKDLSQIQLAQFVDLDGIVVSVDHTVTKKIHADYFRNLELRGRAVLVHTGWDVYWNQEAYLVDHPFLTEDAAQYLVDCGVKLVGIDSMNIDDTRGNTRPVHSTLLDQEILIVEHLCNLGQLPKEGFAFTSVPPKWLGVGTFPVRAFAKIG
jgi:kynurenine formamidase